MSKYKLPPAAEQQGAKNNEVSTNIHKKNAKSRSWTWVVYEEQIEAVRQWLDGSPEIAWAISPKHSDDLNPDGTPKKPHWHLCVSFMGPTTWNVAKGISDEMGLPIPQVCRNTRGMIRYFLHLDNPEKAQYLKADITAGGGFNVEEFLKLTQSEKDAEELHFVQEVESTIHEKGLFEFHQLVQYVLTEKAEMWQHFRKNHNVFKQYLYSLKKCSSPTMSKEQLKAMQELLKSCSSSAGGGAGWTERSEGNLRNRQDEDDYLEEEEELPF